jgi:hypothetical protein
VADVTAAQRKVFIKTGVSMPDGSFYIRNGQQAASDLSSAIQAVGEASPNGDESEIERRNSVRRHIMARAKAVGLYDKVPDTWSPDGSLKHFNIDEFLAHFGVKGMHWGVRKNSSSSPVSDDAARASALKATASKHGTSALSNVELQHLVTRMSLEQQHGRLNPEHVSAGKRVVSEVLKIGGNVAKQQATTYANTYAAKGLEQLMKKAG